MIRPARHLRLVPLAIAAAASLFVLKTIGLVTSGKYSLDGQRQARAATAPAPIPAPLPAAGKADRGGFAAAGAADLPPWLSWARDAFDPDVTGSVAAQPTKDAGAAAKPAAPPDPKGAAAAPKPPGAPGSVDIDHPPGSAGERAVLESLNQRRQELDARARELDVRESVLKATEKRIEARLAEIKETEARITAAEQKKNDAEMARFKGLITMYENMKAKDAAKILDRLDMPILIEVAGDINPRRMSDILAQMSAEVAERLTSEIANRSGVVAKAPTSELPKIEGRPNGT
jgi:flagellar motility protein MotE (MotC chaperone)